jgi:CRP/FNR family nitrogen fixation transcriptional regulator
MRLRTTILDKQPTGSKHTLTGSIELMGAPMSLPRGAKIFGETEPADYVYKVVSGAVRAYRVLSDGRRHIGAFHLPGDLFGLEAGNKYTFSAETITNSTVLVIKRNTMTSLGAHDGDLTHQLLVFAALELDRAREHGLLLVRTAPERVACFLLDMAKRVPDARKVELPMPRQDIADHLGLSVETVSRALTQLAAEATIARPTSRHIELRDPEGLSRPTAAVRKQGQRRP